MTPEYAQTAGDEWVSFPGGELEGRRPKALCSTCRETLKRQAAGSSRPSSPSHLLCFQCYRAELERHRALCAAGQLDTASDARFQFQLPFEPVDTPRLEMLKADRADARAAASHGIGQYVDKRRHAQIAARHALQTIAAGLEARQQRPVTAPLNAALKNEAHAMMMAIHAAELQLPEAWIPFVVSR